jgi:Uma2 family endonuclease
MTIELLKRLFTVQEYDRMIAANIFAPQDRLELIRGEIVQMSPIGRRHAAHVRRLNTLFSEKLHQQAIVDIQNPIELDDNSEPQPDVAILRLSPDFYESAHPQPSDILLLIEVADTTVESDRAVKVPLYAENGIAEVWLININAQCVEIYRQPIATGYQSAQIAYRGQAIAMQAFPHIQLTIDEILG